MEVAMVEPVLVSRYDGYSEANEYGNSKIWRRMQSGQKKSEVFIEYEAEVLSRVSGAE